MAERQKISPGDLVNVTPKEDLTGYVIFCCLYLGNEWVDAGEMGQVIMHEVYVRGSIQKIPGSTHNVVLCLGSWPGGIL